MNDQPSDQELRAARTAYIRAMTRLDKALRAFDDSGTPMAPGPDPRRPHPWTQQQIRIVVETAEAFAEIVETRRTWDALRLPADRP